MLQAENNPDNKITKIEHLQKTRRDKRKTASGLPLEMVCLNIIRLLAFLPKTLGKLFKGRSSDSFSFDAFPV